MTEEAIKQAEEELKNQSPTKLKRTQILSPAKEDAEVKAKGKENEPTAAVEAEKPKVASETAADKIKARAERCGGFQGDEAMRKRADRFGTATSSVLKKAEVSEAIKRR